MVVGRMLIKRHTRTHKTGQCTENTEQMGWWAVWRLTGIVNDGSVVLGLDTGQVDHVAVGRAQIRRLGRAMATAAHEAAARSLDQSARHPAQEEELATSTLVLALQFTCLCPITWICIQLLLL